MNSFLSIPAYYFSVSGLILDAAGVLILGIDLIRIQRKMRTRSEKDQETLNEFSEDYGGAQGWADDIRKHSTWIPESSYSERHAEDEVSYNARNAVESVSELAQCTSGLAEHLAKIVEFNKRQVENAVVDAALSLRLSVFGLVLICVGFLLQILGTLPLR